MKTTPYFRNDVPQKHPEAVRYKDHIEIALHSPVEIHTQPDGRSRRWVYIPEEDKYMRVIVLPDGETVHNAMFDRNFKRKVREK